MDLAVYDNSRSWYVCHPGVHPSEPITFALGTSQERMRQVVAEFERTRRAATVVYFARRMTTLGDEVWEMASICGDVIQQDFRERVVLDLGNNVHVIPGSRHVRTIWGSTVKHFGKASMRKAEGSAITKDKVDVEGWTEPRHQELYHLVFHGSCELWFARFALHFNLAGRHHQWDEFVEKRSKWRPLNANGGAHWLLQSWNTEHPVVGRRLYGIKEVPQ
ncbi:hypothetical protein AOB60_00155 [Streptomyces noursei]|uniref:Uncharacterized protein n=1 Tax=Streptomyces noursei TaxID=1971 RepID=A0A2N8PQW9_STRNR|nr:hypothetical protein AOB60_00155 [Streptomyces noursei]